MFDTAGKMFDTPERTGVYFATGVKVPPEVKWKFYAQGPVCATPVIRDGRVYVGGSGGIYCLKLATGEELWRGDYKCGELGAPTVANGVLYAGVYERKTDDEGSPAVQHYVVALDASSGRELWKIKVPASSPPVVAGGAVYFGAADNACYCVGGKTGRVVWRQPMTASTFAPRHVYTRDRLYSPCFPLALNPRSGRRIRPARRRRRRSERAELPGRSDRGMCRGCSPVLDGRIFAAFDGKRFESFLDGHDAATGKRLWSFKTSWIVMDPVVWDGNVFVGGRAGDPCNANSGDFYVLDAATGKLRWGFCAGMFERSPAVADGVVYTVSHDGYLRALEVSGGRLLWQFKQWGWDVQSPAIADGLVLVAGWDGKLYALGPPSEVSPGDAPEVSPGDTPQEPQPEPPPPDTSRPSDKAPSQ
jgi:outer membrane protein assembly factor BamB